MASAEVGISTSLIGLSCSQLRVLSGWVESDEFERGVESDAVATAAGMVEGVALEGVASSAIVDLVTIVWPASRL